MIETFVWRRLFCLITAAVGLAVSAGPTEAAPPAARKPALPIPLFARDILPILRERCTVCHNHESIANTSVSGGLDLETRDGLVRGVSDKGGYRSIVTGGSKPGGSLLERLESVSPTRLMPRGGPALSAAQIDLFRRWVLAGAPAGPANSTVVRAVNTDFAMPAPALTAAVPVQFATALKLDPALLPAGKKPDSTPLKLQLGVGPAAPVTALAFSPDGQTLAVGSYRAVTLWSVATLQPLKTLTHLKGPVLSLAYRPDGSQLAIGGGMPGQPGELRVADAHTLALIGGAFAGHQETVLSLAWSPDGAYIASGSQDRSARVWKWENGTAKEILALKEHGDTVTRVCFSPDGKALYTASADHNLRRYELPSGSLVRTYSGHNEAVAALAVSADGKRLVSAGTEPALKWWNADTGDVTGNVGGHGAPVNDIVLSKDGKTLLTASADNTLRLWDAGSTGQQRALSGSPDWVYTAAISPDGKLSAGGGADGIVRLWDTATARLRVMLFAWPLDRGDLPEWMAVVPEGYYNASPAWAAKIKTLPAPGPSASAAVQGWLHSTLFSAEIVSKAATSPAPAAPKPPALPK